MRPAEPKMAGFDRTQLEQISVWMERYIAQGKFPKSSILIARTGHEVYHHAARLHDLEAELPFERDTVVRALFNDQTCHLSGKMMILERSLSVFNTPVSGFITAFTAYQAIVQR
ncbi:MAG: hypothetical protein P8M25_14740 [Paracoccaceae bacterium]|nr:hypothetical protein [Paracoccaceae bacterium]